LPDSKFVIDSSLLIYKAQQEEEKYQGIIIYFSAWSLRNLWVSS